MIEGDAAVAVPGRRVLTPDSAWLLRYERSFPGRRDQVREVRAFLREALAGQPRADDVVAIGSELAANACLHSRSGVPGGVLTVRAEVGEGDYLYLEVADDGGSWDQDAPSIRPEHGLDLVQAIAGPGCWGITGDATGRVVWARLPWPGVGRPCGTGDLPADGDAVAALERLAPELVARGLRARLVTPGERLAHLEVGAAGRPGPGERVYAQADWFFWPHAERIAACDDLATAAGAITRAVSTRCGAPATRDRLVLRGRSSTGALYVGRPLWC